MVIYTSICLKYSVTTLFNFLSPLLDFQNPEDEKQLKALLQQNTKFWVNLIAQPNEHNGLYTLNVRGIAELHTQQSCHLNDVLDDLLNL